MAPRIEPRDMPMSNQKIQRTNNTSHEPPSCADDAPPVALSLDTLAQRIHVLDKQVSILVDRLHPVVAPSCSQGTSRAEFPLPPGDSPIHHVLLLRVQQLEEITDRIADLLNRLEI